MAESSKPATPARKKTTKRGPTKAAALKALGLTQDDLDTLKAVAQARELATKVEAQQEAKRETFAALSARGEPVPSDLVNEVASDTPPKTPAAPGRFYMRNLRGPEIRFRLTRQQDRTQRPTLLKPRGQRNDTQLLQPEDLNDPELLAQVDVGLIEIITEAEAREIIQKQSTNQQAAHPALDGLRNELGKPYADGAVRLDPEYNSQGVTVAHLTPQGGGAGQLPSQGRGGVDWAAARAGTPGHPERAIGGNPAIISDGFNPPADVAADAIARSKGLEGPAAGGVNRVVVGPTEKN